MNYSHAALLFWLQLKLHCIEKLSVVLTSVVLADQQPLNNGLTFHEEYYQKDALLLVWHMFGKLISRNVYRLKYVVRTTDNNAMLFISFDFNTIEVNVFKSI